MSKKYSLILFASIIVIVLLYSLLGGGGDKTELDIGEHSLSIGCESFSTNLDYADISAIEAVEVADFGAPVSGGEGKSCRWGLWENEAWGQYTQHTITETAKAVLLHLRDGSRMLLSYESGESTVTLGRLLFDMLSEHGYEVQFIS